MVTVAVPIRVGIVIGGAAVYDKVALGVGVKTADDIQQRGLAASGGTQNSDKFAFTKLKVDALERMNSLLSNGVILSNAL